MDSFTCGTADSDRSDAGLAAARIDSAGRSLYLNRELGQLAFNQRVLALAADAACPVLERLRFFAIVSSNLDEFFEVRVAGLKAAMAGARHSGPDGLPVDEVYAAVVRCAHDLVAAQYRVLREDLLPALEAAGIRVRRRQDYTAAQAGWIRDYFRAEIMPVLTPLGLDCAHPFPRVLNKSLNLAVELEGTDAFGRHSGIAVVQVPRVLPRLIRLPARVAEAEYDFVFLSCVLHAHVDELFPGMRVRGCYPFR